MCNFWQSKTKRVFMPDAVIRIWPLSPLRPLLPLFSLSVCLPLSWDRRGNKCICQRQPHLRPDQNDPNQISTKPPKSRYRWTKEVEFSGSNDMLGEPKINKATLFLWIILDPDRKQDWKLAVLGLNETFAPSYLVSPLSTARDKHATPNEL